MNDVAKAALVSAFRDARSRVGVAEHIEKRAVADADRAIGALKSAKRDLAALREALEENGIPEPAEPEKNAVCLGGAALGLAGYGQMAANQAALSALNQTVAPR